MKNNLLETVVVGAAVGFAVGYAVFEVGGVTEGYSTGPMRWVFERQNTSIVWAILGAAVALGLRYLWGAKRSK